MTGSDPDTPGGGRNGDVVGEGRIERLALDGRQLEVASWTPERLASEPSLAASEPSLAAGEPVLAPGEPELAAGEPELAAGEPELAAGEPELAAGEPVVAATQPAMASAPMPVVFCHDGLGTFATFGDIPDLVCHELQTPVWAYNRAGHGASTPAPDGAWPADWLHREADLLVSLLDRLVGDQRVHLVGHSDGGSIALLTALQAPDRVGQVTTLAAHTWVEPVCTAAIRAMRDRRDRMVEGLARIHAAPAEIFEAWSGVWVSEEFAAWDIRGRLGALEMAVRVVQGDADEYATGAMVTDTVAAIGDNAVGIVKAGWPHLMNRTHGHEVAELVIDLHRSGG